MLSNFLSNPNNLMWLGVAIASGAMLAWPLIRPGGGSRFVTPAQATLLINREDATVLDVRDTDAYANAHILNARNIPVAQLNARIADLARHKARPLILVCENGQRSSGAAAILKQHGFENLVTLQGGFPAWKQAGLPIGK